MSQAEIKVRTQCSEFEAEQNDSHVQGLRGCTGRAEAPGSAERGRHGKTGGPLNASIHGRSTDLPLLRPVLIAIPIHDKDHELTAVS